MVTFSKLESDLLIKLSLELNYLEGSCSKCQVKAFFEQHYFIFGLNFISSLAVNDAKKNKPSSTLNSMRRALRTKCHAFKS